MSQAEVESARREWEDGHRRLLDETRDRAARERLYPQVDAITDELRRRVGGTFTLGELAREYTRADDWARGAVSEQAPAAGWPRTLSLVEAAAFHLYARGAVDFAP